jgi:photosystem II stability/assembly factor-like uncharacterized protein
MWDGLAKTGAQGIPAEQYGFIAMGASSSGNILLAGAAQGKLYYSDDGGETFFTLEGIGVEEYWTGVSVSEDGLHLAAAGSSLYVSEDSGDTWSVHPFVQNYDGQTQLQISDDGGTLAKGGESLITEVDVSHDYGESWIENDFETCDSPTAFALSADGRKVAVLHYYKPLKLSDDGGETWREVSSGTGQWQHMAMSPNGTEIALLDFGTIKYGDEAKFGLYISVDAGDTWTMKAVEGIRAANHVSMTDDGAQLLVSGNTVDAPFLLSMDSGETWNEIPTPDKQNPDWPQYITVFSNDDARIVAMERTQSVWTSEDFGETWEKRLEGRSEE